MDLEGLKILIVDDEEDIRDFLELVLQKAGADVQLATNGSEALLVADKNIPDVIILDKLMPVMNGIETCKALRENPKLSHTKILMLSAISDIDSQVEGLDIGADDYLVKPVKSNLLISKIKAQVRTNIQSKSQPDILEYKHIRADRAKYLVFVQDKEITLPKKEFELLYLLMTKPDNVFRRDEILEFVWGKDIYIGDRTIDVHIRKLREKIGDDYFKTVKGIGYKFAAF